jgi:hypothetical protein
VTQPEEQPLTWGEVVESDEIYSAKTRKWYPVRMTVRSPDGRTVTVEAIGIPRFTKPAGDPVRVRRGPTGRAVDVVTVIFSGPTSREA